MLYTVYWTGITFTSPHPFFFLLYFILNITPRAHTVVITLLSYLVGALFFSSLFQQDSPGNGFHKLCMTTLISPEFSHPFSVNQRLFQI